MKQPVRKVRTKRSLPRPAPAPPPAEESVAVSGSLPGNVTQLRGSLMTLVAIYGKGEQKQDVLVPLIDWQLNGLKLSDSTEDDDPGPEIFSHLVSLDNVAFLLQDIGSDLTDAIRILGAQSTGGVKPLKPRMHYCARMLRRAASHISAAAEQIEVDLIGEEADAEE